MKKAEIVKIIKEEKIMAIVRMKEQLEVPIFLKKLINGGLKVLEITSNTPGFSEEITNARTLYSNSDVLIGAGTVTNIKIAKEAIHAGAQFLVTPNTNIEVIKIAHKHDIPVLMGAVTPTEICSAIENGADIIKLFPAGSLGINYFKSIKAPLDNVDFFVVGGINVSNIKDWMDAGAAGVGLGSVLTQPAKQDNSLQSIERTVKKFIQLIAK
ncbi:bifunctional 4-hydroxy-2-oxoglutarate aldolase/2-dehydro-3-deoxy-phosphogluconate aldolase [Maribacter sp. ACAM166]|uniref:bifunctional 4-hydroxy-2-oxoglutarate aldolase/2-dehydro-3-deoxy-phosphogluconate aldolase n=1 Tax=Maribacter sp. ACAM166 TaxID=2508996 RepID=UPI0010FCDD46|nr:bifunctional 4-hydroxy-2-oxoglutarate aldolase/2-dehydro-3-deoxy-phosphogluconate aldolase [Maribacter sp. ACAM166]TLP70508.1 bifunctional 4-hydroxy-2-oxoglutarate aldolase/2-dehydro-3-deoxy-phosphogluconate aldolase [Maribacter sp. ACAM166]